MISEDLLMHYQILTSKQREEFQGDWAGYTSACRLSSGSDPQRAQHWRQEASIRGNRLAQRMGIQPKREAKR